MSQAPVDRDALQDSLLETMSVAEFAGSKGVVRAALILTYSTIDTLSWLAAPRDDTPVHDRYVRWVERYMLPEVPQLQCTAEEVYATRCAVVHTMTAESNSHRRKHSLRCLVYPSGTGDAQELQRRIDAGHKRGKCVAVHINDLTAGMRLGAARMFEEALTSAPLAARLESRKAKFFAAYALSDL